ncbi:DUF4132 domain-containing protein [Methylomagnum ishizawai]|uniref:DUF4132 domain-containing protein n=1 Tax=Methylomagnum ishizawai TaxID=1760988 RepID=UPI001C330494|nr:DUF4132 domain-containing protein [Methylomagnum ishizawai]BBL76839.1 hypothetical protein MishRS11D_39370 [Methylomagnum ishizawai]
MTTAPQLDWPTGGMVWTDQRRGKLPIIRGIRVPAPYVPDDCLTHPPAFHDLQPYELQKVQNCWARLAAALDIQGAPWTQAEAADRLAAERLRNPDPAYWREVFAQCAARQPESWQARPELVWAIQAASVAHSLAFATRMTLETGADLFHDRGCTEHSYHGLRHALVAAPEADYQAALETAAEFRGRSRLLDRMVSFLFPEQRAWAEECVEPGASINQSWWLDETAMSVAAACRHFRDRYLGSSQAYEICLLYLYIYGEEAALPVIGIALDSQDTKQEREWFIDFVLRIRVPGVLPLLMARLDNREVHAKLDQLTGQWPAALLKCAIERAAATGNSLVESWALALALRLPDIVEPALSACSEAGRDYFAGLLATRTHAAEAPAEALPELLRDPPWVKRIQAIPTLALMPIEQPDIMVWQDGQRDEWAKPPIDRTHWLIRNQPSGEPDHLYALRLMGIKKTAFDLALAGGPLGAEDLLDPSWQLHRYPALLSLLPDPAALGLWNTLPAAFWRGAWGMRTLIARFQLDCVPGLLAFIPTATEVGLEMAFVVRSARLVPIAADAWKRLKKARPHAEAWLLAHAETAIAALIPPAFGKDRVPRETAQAALRWLAERGFEADLRRIAASYGDAAAQAMEVLLRADPALMVPARMPKLPALFTPTAFRRPLLASGGALPLTAVEHVARMLTISKLDAPYVGLNAVKAACTRDSLAAFAWDVFEAWLVAGAPPKENWAYHVLGWFGDDATARRLTEKIRVWPTHAALARAIVGLDLLATIGTDGALRELHGIAQKVKSKPLQEKARQKITQVAEILDLTAEELADRLVPDLGLDGQGKAVLDFGPRRFVMEFDEALKPLVKDEAGLSLKDLPKPNQKDDAALATAAVARFKAIKKEAKAIASLQTARLEQAMVGRRRWGLELFRQLFVEHPLMRHLAKRLVWGVYRDGLLVDAFRVAEDLTLADRRDAAYSLPAEALVGLVHALELPDDLGRDFCQIFADYEIAQPFKQLGRETYALGEAERGADMIDRFRDKAVATGSILGLAKQGWEQGEADGGYVFSVVKRLPGGLEAELSLGPGYHLGEVAATPAQALSEIRVHRLGDRCTERRLKMAELDAILVSELLRDMDLLAVFKA